jgi:hypothetical protein
MWLPSARWRGSSSAITRWLRPATARARVRCSSEAWPRRSLKDYGRAPGPKYLRGAKTCSAVMSRLFKHLQAQLATSIEVTKVLVGGGRADVVVVSRTVPAS